MSELSPNQFITIQKTLELIESMALGKLGKGALKAVSELPEWAIAEVPKLRERLELEFKNIS